MNDQGFDTNTYAIYMQHNLVWNKVTVTEVRLDYACKIVIETNLLRIILG